MSHVKIREDELSWRQVGEDVVVLDERTSIYLQLQGSGTMLWLALVTGSTPEQLAASLIQRFGVQENVARRDVRSFLADLEKRELIVSV